MYTQLILVIPREDPEYPPMYFDSVSTQVFPLTAKTQVQKEFSYPVREGLAGKGAYFLIELHMGGGDMITFVQSPTFDIAGNLKVLALRKPRVIDTL